MKGVLDGEGSIVVKGARCTKAQRPLGALRRKALTFLSKAMSHIYFY